MIEHEASHQLMKWRILWILSTQTAVGLTAGFQDVWLTCCVSFLQINYRLCWVSRHPGAQILTSPHKWNQLCHLTWNCHWRA